MRIRRSRSGFSATEIVVAMSVTLIVTGAGLGFYRGESHAVKDSAARQQANETLRAAIEMISGEIRRTGYDPSAAAFVPGASGITRAERRTIQIDRDLDGDGTIEPTTVDPDAERILYSHDTASGEIRRTVAGVTRTLVKNVPSLRFEYFDLNGNTLTLSGSPQALSATDRDAVRMVRIRLQLYGVGIHPTPTFTLSQHVSLSNRIAYAF